MKYLSFLILILFGFFLSCKKSDVSSNLNIHAGFECGWGSGTDTLDISKSSIRYVYYVPAKSPLPQINKTRSVPDSEWLEILNAVNIDEFVKLDYNSCNICVDGCDEWISVQNDQISHKIRFAKGLKIDAIDKLQNKLTQLRSEFSK